MGRLCRRRSTIGRLPVTAASAPFRWRNCYADVQTSKHDLTILSYFDDVIVPALSTLQAQIDGLGHSDNPGDIFAQSDLQDVLLETKLAFGLSIQSIWERQIRAYVRGCARELQPNSGLEAKVVKADWKGLQTLFRTLRGIDLEAFPSFATLDLLQHLGNAGRHGDGASAIELFDRCPDLWPTRAHMPEDLGGSPLSPPPVGAIDIPVGRLREFVAAVATFWVDATYIYNESIERKHESLEIKLANERQTRSWRPPAATGQIE